MEPSKMSSSEVSASPSATLPAVDLTTLTGKINAHLRDHHVRTSEDCKAVMGSVEANLESLMDQHFSPEADPTRVSEMLLFHVMFSGQQYLECEHAQMVFSEGGVRAVSYPVWKLCALLPLPRFAGLHPRLVAHIGLLASLWLPRDAGILVEFLEDIVELLQNLESLWSVAQDRGEDTVLVQGTRVLTLSRLSVELERSPLEIELPSKYHLSLCRAAMTSVAANLCVLMPVGPTTMADGDDARSIFTSRALHEERIADNGNSPLYWDPDVALSDLDPLEARTWTAERLSVACPSTTVKSSASAPPFAGAPMSTGTPAYARLWSLLGRHLNAELRADTEVLHQISLEALLALLEDGPPVSAMPLLAIDCLRLAGRALVPCKKEREERPGADRTTLIRLPTIQKLIGKCIRLLFPRSPGNYQAAGLSTAHVVGNHMGYLASLNATLPCISQWWTDCSREWLSAEKSTSSNLPSAGDRNHQGGVSLARAVAGAYASAVEARLMHPFALRAAALPGANGGVHGGEVSLGGFTPRRRRQSSLLRTNSQHIHTHANAVPRQFGSAVAALSSVPCVQPELVRVLRAVLQRFPRVAVRVLQRADLGGWSSDSECRSSTSSSSDIDAQGKPRDEGEGDEASGQGEMAPPPPRAPPGKKRRVTLEGGSLRAAAAGGDGEGNRNDSTSLSGLDVRGMSGTRRQTSTSAALFSGSERLSLFSGEGAVCEALDIVLSSASAAIEFFEATVAKSPEAAVMDGVDGVDIQVPASTTAAASAGPAGSGDEDLSETATKQLCALLRHTAAIASAVQVLTPFADGAGLFVTGSGGSWNRNPEGRKKVNKGRNNGNGRSNTGVELFPVLARLLDGFTAAVKAAERYGADAKVGGGGERNITTSHKASSSVFWAPHAVAWLSDMLVTCAGALPLAMLTPAENNVGGDREQSKLSRLTAVVRLVAENSLNLLLAQGSTVLTAALEGMDAPPLASVTSAIGAGAGQPRGTRALSLWTPGLFRLCDGPGSSGVLAGESTSGSSPGRAVSTVLGPAAPEASLLLKCFLLAAATAARPRGLGGAGGDQDEESKHNGRRNVPIGAEAENGAENNGQSGGRGTSHDGAHAVPVPSPTHEAFLAALRHDSPFVRQGAVAALPLLISFLDNEGCEDSRKGPWERRFLPVLLALTEDGTSAEAVRLELAAALPRLGASLYSARRRKQEHPPHPPTTHIHGSSKCADRLRDPHVLGPNSFADLLPLWPLLLKDESGPVRAAAARSVLAAATAAPLPQLRATGAAGASVLRSLADMLACGDPEVAWVVAGGAGQFVAGGGKILRALYAGGGGRSGSGGRGVESGNGRSENTEEEETHDGDNDDDEDTLGEEEERERERRLRERAVDRFIEAVNALLQEHGDRLRLGRWQSLHEFTALLRALGSIGCESDPTDELGLNIYLWTLIRLVDVWVEKDNECGPVAHEQIVRVCNHGRVPLPKLLRLPLTSSPAYVVAATGGGGRGVRGAAQRGATGNLQGIVGDAGGGKTEDELDSGSILAPLMAKLMETGHVQQFVEQALGSRDFRSFLEDSVAHVLPVFVAGQQALAVEQLAALCDQFEVADVRGKDPPQRLLNRHLPHVLTDVLMRGQSAWAGNKPSPGFQFLLNYFPKVSPKAMIEGVLPQILEQVSWQLCGPRAEQATVALQAVAHISYEHESAEDGGEDRTGNAVAALPPKNSRKKQRKADREETSGGEAGESKAEASMERKVESMVTQQFLFLMSNVVSKRWRIRTTEDKIRAIQVLGRLVGFLSEDEAGGLFPKVMATLQSALADPHRTPAQDRAAYRVMMGYILGLSDDSLAENLSTIVVNVLALMEEVKSNDGNTTAATTTAAAVLPTTPISAKSNRRRRRRERFENDNILKQALAYSRAGEASVVGTTVDAEVSKLSVTAPEAGGDEAAEIRATAAALLRRLIVDKQESLRAHFHKIPFMPQLPDLPALGDVTNALSQELGRPSLGDQLGRLTPLLKDESTEVRRAALKHLLLVLRRDKPDLTELVLEGSREVDPVVSRLLKGLLELSTDSDGQIRDLCGACLGEVGAIDPARVGLRLRDDGAAHFGGNSSAQALFEAAPWEITVEEMSLLLLKDLLVPAFRASTTSMEQDRVAFGIQELLHLLSDGPPENNGGAGNGSPDSFPVGGSGGGDEARLGPMPARLARRLHDAQVFSIVEPFWRSTYKLSDRAPSSSVPFFCDPAMTVSLERWLSSWCRNLISRARGPLRPAFEVCRGAVRSHAPMAQFLLNHLVADVLVFGDEAAADQVLAEVLAVMRVDTPASTSTASAARTPGGTSSSPAIDVAATTTAAATRTATSVAIAGTTVRSVRGWPIYSRTVPSSSSVMRYREGDVRVGRRGGGVGGGPTSGGGGGIEHIATQATFRLLDRLGHWAAGRGRRQGGAGAAGATGWPIDSVRKGALLSFVRRVPRGVLVKASMRVRAYTRALRYLEEQIRAEHAARRLSTGRGTSLLASAGAFRNDGANGTLPVLNPAELHQLLAIYRRLSDEPDGMVGLDVMRGAAGVSASMKQRTWQHEHAEDWAGALEVYEQALQERELVQLSGKSTRQDRTDLMYNRYDQMAAAPAASSSISAPLELSQTQPLNATQVARQSGKCKVSRGEDIDGDGGGEGHQDKDTVGFEGDEWEEGEVERGMLHAFVELGHLEMLLHQASGMLSVESKRHLAPLLLPVAVEAAWRLQRWPLLQDLLHQHKAGTCHLDGVWRSSSSVGPSASFAVDEQSGESRYRLALGKVMLRMKEAQPGPFSAAVAEARADVMAGLGAASMESYRRAYPFLLKLHSLREAEQTFEVMHENRDSMTRRGAFLALSWDERLLAMSSSLRQLAPVLAVRRAAFELCSLEGLQGENWLCLAKRARAAGQFAVAGAALRRACRLGICQGKLAFQEAKLAREREGVHRALVILEPVETNVESLRALVSLDSAALGGGGGASSSPSSKRSASGVAAVLDEEERLQIARKLLLTTDWIVEAGQKHGQAVVARYKLALQLRPGWEKGYFCLGQYVDFLFKSRVEELQRLAARHGGVDSGGDKKKARQRATGVRGWEGDELAHRLALQAMENYAKSLRFGAKYIFQSMPRLLTLWFQVGFLRDPDAEDGGGQGGPRSVRSSIAKAVVSVSRSRKRQAVQEKSAVVKLQSDSTELVRNTVRSISPYMWYTALPQLTSRVGHPNTDVLEVIVEALAMLLKAHPKQALWHLSSLCLSISNTRRQVGIQVFERARRLLMEDGREGDAAAVKDGQALFSELIKLAEEQPPKNQKEANFKIGHRMDLRRFIVPVQAGLTVSLPQAPRKDTPVVGGSAAVEAEALGSQAEVLAAAVVAAHNPFPGAEMHIKKFQERVKYMASKAKPKRVSLRTLETGEVVYFLCKQERNGDLRKDARLMEFNGMINRLLQKDPAGAARKLRLRTYAVICLNEECGVLEWVQDTTGFRHLVNRAVQIRSRKLSVKAPSIAHIKGALDRVQYQSDRGSLTTAVQMYRANILEHQQPCFHLWFVEHFAEPTAWFEARTTFARSAAVWSSVGHVVGLGDRHGENLLIHTESGECVHVDFDCLFDKGLTLARPEIVPFRLTPSMMDGMGLCGFEGVYRRVMETCMSVLRTNRETLLSVLEPFLQDPTVGWGRSGRAQRSTTGDDGGLSEDRRGGRGGGADLGRERENEDADRVLRVINERLQGRYNLAVPRTAGRRAVDEGNDLPLSVQGQVHRLITEATSQENLCQMYIGWMPWM